MDLLICNNLNINIYLSINLSQNIIDEYKQLEKYDYDLFNKSDKFYTDICSTFTSIDNTDIILSNRRKIFYKDYDKYCENGCALTGYDLVKRRVICKCKIKNEINYEAKIIKFDKQELLSYFRISTYANFAVLKCYKLLFSLNGQKNNYGSYLLSILNLFNIMMMIDDCFLL